MTRVLFAILAALVIAIPSATTTPASAASCQFVLGFKVIYDAIPDVVGNCLVDEHHNPANGDGLQETSGKNGSTGLMVWRKADNWTAYTDGYRTWINGPNGLQQRLNTERFPWERDVVPPPLQQQVGTQWVLHQDGEKSFKYPAGWVKRSRVSGGITHNYYYSPDGKAMLYYMAPFKTGASFKPEDILVWNMKAWNGSNEFVWGPQERTTINGHPAVIQWYGFPKSGFQGISAAIQYGEQTHIFDTRADTESWATYEPLLLESIRSYTPK